MNHLQTLTWRCPALCTFHAERWPIPVQIVVAGHGDFLRARFGHLDLHRNRAWNRWNVNAETDWTVGWRSGNCWSFWRSSRNCYLKYLMDLEIVKVADEDLVEGWKHLKTSMVKEFVGNRVWKHSIWNLTEAYVEITDTSRLSRRQSGLESVLFAPEIGTRRGPIALATLFNWIVMVESLIG